LAFEETELQATKAWNPDPKGYRVLGRLCWISLKSSVKFSFQNSLSIYQKIGDRQSEAASLNNFGSADQRLSQYEKAI